jgi:putative endonuclease
MEVWAFFMSMNYVYILYSPEKNSFYKGQTNDIHDRLNRHNSGFEKATFSGKPWILLWYTSKLNRSEAILLERKLKNLSIKRTLEFILKYREGIPSPDELDLVIKLSGC